MLRYQLSLCLLLAVASAPLHKAGAEDFPRQSIDYDISYKCTFINEIAAHATVNIGCRNGNFIAALQGRSIPIFGTVYCVNDTLNSTFSPATYSMRPEVENISYQSGYYRKPHNGDYSQWNSPYAYRTIAGNGYLSASNATMECVTLTSDMLCMFYYAKAVDFDALPLNVAVDVAINEPTGRQVTLQITSQGRTTYGGRPVYNLLCNYTYGNALSAYPITFYIDVEKRIPVYIAADIKIGKVAMEFSE